MDPLVALKTQNEDFEVEFEVVPVEDHNAGQEYQLGEISFQLAQIDEWEAACQQEIDLLDHELGRLTNQSYTKTSPLVRFLYSKRKILPHLAKTQKK